MADNDAALFAGSLAQVVAGRLDVDDLGEAAVLGALHTAAADDVVRGLPDGLASRIDSGGRNLSGGQRQRVRLARATIADPAVLLAVDPTSALDAATEATIVDRLIRHRRGRTTLVTSTSALVLQGADEVHLARRRSGRRQRHPRRPAGEPRLRRPGPPRSTGRPAPTTPRPEA